MIDVQTAVLFGAVGGLLPDVLRMIKAGQDGQMPTYLKSVMFYVSLILLAGVGALVGWLGQAKSVQEALAYGFGGPEVLSRLLSTKHLPAQVDRGEPGKPSKVRIWQWWSM